uniref:RNA-dependent RNA polymerase n=1 Tax=Riboviria sp. TaxID=2585031 RepID=A0A8K1JE95_9VIRU|nr:MAG: RNA-dependent RNA polymerase [Riboviria sp.]
MMIQRNSEYGLVNNPAAQEALTRAADNLASFLSERICRSHSQQVPLSYSGALYVIEKLRQSQPKAKIIKLLRIAKEMPWEFLQSMSNVPKSGTQVFIKDEGYPSAIKPPRLIAFPQEGEKLLMSMAFYHIMHPMFSSAYCTKEIPENDRPKVIERRLGELPNRFVADYTSFECVPNKLMMRLGEHRVLRQLVHSDYHFLFDVIEAGGVLRAKNGFTIKTTAVQYSGRYTTSLSNTIRNKLLLDSVALQLGLSLSGYRAVFEGDDSLSAWPSFVTEAMISDALGRLGVAADIARVEEIGEAGYCSMFWNRDYELVCEPIKVVATFPFSCSALSANPRNASDLLAAKAMSLAYRAPGCPIVSAIVRRYIKSDGLMETRNDYEARWYRQFSHVVRKNNRSERQRNSGSMHVHFDRWDLVREPSVEQRRLFWKIFGIPPADQVAAEHKILVDDGFTFPLTMCLKSGESKAGVNLDELRTVFWEMSHAANQL